MAGYLTGTFENKHDITQGDVEQLLRDAASVRPLPLVINDPRLRAYGPQFATMLLMRESLKEGEAND